LSDTRKPKRVAILGMHLESNAFAPVCREDAFRSNCYLAGDEIVADARAANPRQPAEIAVQEASHHPPIKRPVSGKTEARERHAAFPQKLTQQINLCALSSAVDPFDRQKFIVGSHSSSAAVSA